MKALKRLPLGSLTDRPDHELVGVLRMPELTVSPLRAIVKRIIGALLALVVTVVIVYLDRGGYRDANGDGLSLVDCLYYATVSLTATGYGDIVPVTEAARLVNVLVLTPMRVLFLIVLVGTTLELLTERSRQSFKIQRWRSKVRDHVVVVGYGTKGRAAVVTLLGDGRRRGADRGGGHGQAGAGGRLRARPGHRHRLGHALRRAARGRRAQARAVVVATNRDDTAVLVTLTARELAPKAQIVASVREAENEHLLRQSGADQVVVSSETAGRLLGMATSTPSVVAMVEDLLTPDVGMAIAEREVEDGRGRRLAPAPVRHRAGRRPRRRALPGRRPEADAIETGDRLLYVKKVTQAEKIER